MTADRAKVEAVPVNEPDPSALGSIHDSTEVFVALFNNAFFALDHHHHHHDEPTGD